MTIIGQSISHYSVTDKIGEGGMGEVYRATDTRLNREVALKLLPEILAGDRQRMTRFEREAQVLASLNHPNIAAIYGLENSANGRALVMELVEGEDLSERIARGPIPMKEALRIALQIAEALESAHEKGIIHRDLKPANIKLSSEGKVKVLDFGLAKALEGEMENQPDLTKSPTLSLAATQAGIILGTAGYMSPEQARGKPADRRADIWSFGVVLYEMLVGRKVFDGDDLSMVMAAVMMKDPAWEHIPAGVPRKIRDLLERCLRKEPDQRVQAIGDVRITIQEALSQPEAVESSAISSESPAASRWLRLPVIAALAAVSVLSILGTWMLMPKPEPVKARPLQLEVAVPGEFPFFMDQGSAVILSKDGSRLAYMTGSSSLPTLSLYLRPLNRMKSEVLTQGAYNPFFSPDGQWVGFVTPTELKKVSVSGGTPLTLCPVNLSRGASWGETGLIVFAPVPAGGLSLVSAAGGEPRQLTQLEEGEQSHRWPQFLPGGEKVLFTSYSSSDPNAGRIEVVDVSSGERTVVHHGGTYARYSESGHILYANNGTVFASPFDLGQIALTALPAPVLQGITMNREGCAHFDVSDDGNLVYLTGETLGAQRTLKWVNDRGGLESMTETRRDYLHPRLSPEGGRLAAEIFADGNRDIWILDLERDTQTRLTFDEAVDQYPIWSHDGQFVYFGSHREGKYGIFRKRADGSSQEERLTESDAVQSPYSASPDGKFLTIDEQNLKTGSYDIHVLSLEGDGTSAPFLAGSFSEADMVFSPDSEWVAHESNESGEWEIYVRPFPGPGGRWQISTGGGEYPRWSGDGRNLFYRTGNTIWKVPVAVQGDSFEVGRPEELLKLSGSYQAEWDVAADGKRFVIIQEREGGDRGDGNLVNFTFNWFEELELLLETAR